MPKSNSLSQFLLLASTLIATCSNTAALAADTVSVQSPKEFYAKYHAAMAAANKIEDLQQYLCKRANKEINETPDPMRPMLFGIMKTLMPGPVKVESEKVDGDKATLNLVPDYSKAPKADPNEKGTGSVTLIKEDGAWKVDKEKWDFKLEAGAESAAKPASPPASN